MFFAGDSAGHCLPLTAEGIRTAIYFGLACGRELRAVLEGRAAREQALARYGAFSDAHARKFRWLLARAARRRADHAQPRRDRDRAHVREPPPVRAGPSTHYLAIAPPSFVGAGSGGARPPREVAPAV